MPLGVAWVLGLSMFVCGALVIGVAVRGMRGDLPRNGLVGIRTPASMQSDEAWITMHRVAGPWLVAAGAGAVIPGVICLFRPSTATGQLVVLAGCGVMVALVGAGTFAGSMALRDRG